MDDELMDGSLQVEATYNLTAGKSWWSWLLDNQFYHGRYKQKDTWYNKSKTSAKQQADYVTNSFKFDKDFKILQ